MTFKTFTCLMAAASFCMSAMPVSAQYYGRHYHDDTGAAIAGGVLGLAAGAIAAGAAADAAKRSDPNFIAYCARKYPSFDPQSGAYLASDGRWYPCQ